MQKKRRKNKQLFNKKTCLLVLSGAQAPASQVNGRAILSSGIPQTSGSKHENHENQEEKVSPQRAWRNIRRFVDFYKHMFLFRKLKLDELLPKFTGGAALCAKFASAIDAILALFGKETLNKSQKK